MSVNEMMSINSKPTSDYPGYQNNASTNIPKVNTDSRSEKTLIEAIEKANHIQLKSTECKFSIHEETKQIMIKLIDTSTKEVVKEIPSEKILDMFATMCEVAGLFVDEKR